MIACKKSLKATQKKRFPMPFRYSQTLLQAITISLLFFSITNKVQACDTLSNYIYYRLMPGYTLYPDGSVCSCNYSHMFCPKCDLNDSTPTHEQIPLTKASDHSSSTSRYWLIQLLYPIFFPDKPQCTCESIFNQHRFCPACDLKLDADSQKNGKLK